MKNSVLSLLAMILAASSSNASNAVTSNTNGYYVGVEAGRYSNSGFKIQEEKKKFFSHSGAIAAIKFGKEWNSAFRTEIELVHLFKGKGKLELKSSDVSTTTHTTFKSSASSNAVFLNALYSFNTQTKFSPYVGLGIGMAQNKLAMERKNVVTNAGATTTTVKKGSFKKAQGLAMQAIVGGSYKLTERVSLDLSYRFMSLGKVAGVLKSINGKAPTNEEKKENSIKGKKTIHAIMLGARYSF